MDHDGPWPPVEAGRPVARALAAGIGSPEALARWAARDVLALHGIGAKGLAALAADLAARGLAFAGEEGGGCGSPPLPLETPRSAPPGSSPWKPSPS